MYMYFTDKCSTGHYWIGLNDIMTENTFVWLDSLTVRTMPNILFYLIMVWLIPSGNSFKGKWMKWFQINQNDTDKFSMYSFFHCNNLVLQSGFSVGINFLTWRDRLTELRKQYYYESRYNISNQHFLLGHTFNILLTACIVFKLAP